MSRKSLEQAKNKKYDEYYTRYEDIAAELSHYKEFLKDKIVYCNCDDPRWSNFWKYLHEHFNEFQLKELIATFLAKEGEQAFIATYKGGNDSDASLYEKTLLEGNGSFDSPECIAILNKVDLTITNPPFSIANKRFLPTLLESKKDFIIIGDLLWSHCKMMAPKILKGEVQLGFNEIHFFINERKKEIRIPGKFWYTNLPIEKNLPFIELTKTYKGHEEEYPFYDNYKGIIEVKGIRKIPIDFDGVMGVPLSFLFVYNPEQFELLGLAEGNESKYRTKIYSKEEYDKASAMNRTPCLMIDDKPKSLFSRLLIRRKK